MKPEEMQQLSPDESAASLSFATMLSEGLMPKQSPTKPETTPPPQETGENETPTEEGTGEIPEEKETMDMMNKDDMMKEHMEEMDKNMEKMMSKMEGKMETMMESVMKKMMEKHTKEND